MAVALAWLSAWLGTTQPARKNSSSDAAVLPCTAAACASGGVTGAGSRGVAPAWLARPARWLWDCCTCCGRGPLHTPLGKRVGARLVRLSPTRLVCIALVVVALFGGISLLLLESLGRLRFQGYLVSHARDNGQLGFYHEMDVDMQQLRAATKRPHGMLFPAAAGNTQREVSAWFTERRRRTNGRKFLIGCTADWRGYVLRSFLHMFTELKTAHGWQDLNTTTDPVSYFYEQDAQKAPSVLLFCLNSFHYPMALLLEHTKYFQELRALGTLIMVWNDDLHYYDQFTPTELREKIFRRTDVLVGTYTYEMDEYFASVLHARESGVALQPRDMPLTMWLPHSAGPDFTQFSFNDAPINKLLLSGARGSNWYPLRHWLGQYQSTHAASMDVYQHSGYYVSDNQSEIFATYLRAYRAGITTTLLFQYVIAKIFEIPATGALLVVNRDTAPLLEALGMNEREHYVGFDRMDPEATIEWVMDPANRAQVDRIRRSGMDLVHARHLVTHRVKALDLFVTEGTSTYKVPPTYALSGPCPSVALPSESECSKRFTREALYKCDMWFCGAQSFFRP